MLVILVQNLLQVIDQFLSSLEQRLDAYKNIRSLSGFLYKLEEMDAKEIEGAAVKLHSEYKDDLEPKLGNELVQFTVQFTYEDEEKTTNKIRERTFFLQALDGEENCRYI